MLKGKCQCGAVSYEAAAISGDLWHCHCQTCRKSHAAERNTAARVRREDFRIVQGAEYLTSYESCPGKFRKFCSICGSHVYAERPELPDIVLRTGTLDTDPGKRPAYHTWVSHDVPWLAHADGLPRYPEGLPPQDF
jgi:hypothetical protein